MLLIYLGLSIGYKAFLNKGIDSLESDLDELRFEVPKEEQDELVRFFSQIGNIEDILDDHIIASNLFPILEGSTHSQVAFASMDLSTVDGKVSLEGVAANYDALVAQLTILESIPEIKRIVLDNSQRNGGVVGFRVTLTVDKSVFDFREPAFIPQLDNEPTNIETQ